MSDDQRKDADKAYGEAVISSETSTYAFVPRISYVPKDMAAGDPTFWNPKPEMVMPKPRLPREQQQDEYVRKMEIDPVKYYPPDVNRPLVLKMPANLDLVKGMLKAKVAGIKAKFTGDDK